MNRYVMEEFYNDPALRRRLFGEARRDRARAVSAGFNGLRAQLKALKARFTPGLRPARWLARLG